MSRAAWILCAGCGGAAWNKGRNLCCTCYQRYRTWGLIENFPRTTRASADVVEDYDFLARQGYSRRDAADRMGITVKALEKALQRQGRTAARRDVA